MAQFPCSIDGQRYRGPQQTAYPAMIEGADAVRGKVRLCPSHFHDLDEWCLEHLAEAIDELATVEVCGVCQKDEPKIAVFVTLYATGKEREDFWGRVCADCLPVTRVALFGATRGVQPT